jgi:hypothetical protein
MRQGVTSHPEGTPPYPVSMRGAFPTRVRVEGSTGCLGTPLPLEMYRDDYLE